MTSVLSNTMEKQIEAADKLVHSEFEPNISLYSALFARATVRPLGEFCRRFVWCKNQGQVSEGETPSGFQLNVSPFAPIFSRPFHPTAMYNGMICFPLSAGVHTMTSRKTKKRVDLSYFTNNNALAKELGSVFQGEPDTDDDDNFAGIFYGNEGTETQFFVVVQANNCELSREVYRMICDNEPESMNMVRDCAEMRKAQYEARMLIHSRRIAQNNTSALDEPDRLVHENLRRMQEQRKVDPDNPPYTTWKKLFIDNPRIYEIEKAQEHYRASIVCRILKAAGLGPPSDDVKTDEDVIQAILHNSNTIKLSFNCVRQADVKNPVSDLIYLSKLASVFDVTKNGILVRGACEGGVSLALIQGLIENQTVAGFPFIGVSIATGPVKAGVMIDEHAADKSDSLIWSAEDSEHPLLSRVNYRSRDSAEWKEWEKQCGVSGKEMRLMPIKVAVTNPRQKGIGSIETIHNITV